MITDVLNEVVQSNEHACPAHTGAEEQVENLVIVCCMTACAPTYSESVGTCNGPLWWCSRACALGQLLRTWWTCCRILGLRVRAMMCSWSVEPGCSGHAAQVDSQVDERATLFYEYLLISCSKNYTRWGKHGRPIIKQLIWISDDSHPRYIFCGVGNFTFSTFRVLTVQSGKTSSDTLETRMSLNTDIGLLSSGQYLWQRIWNVTNTYGAQTFAADETGFRVALNTAVCPLAMAVQQPWCISEHSLCLSRNTESAWRRCGCLFPRSSSKSQPQCLAEDPGWQWTHWGKDSPGKAGGLRCIQTDIMTHKCKISVLGNDVASFTPTADTHRYKAGVDVVGAGATRFGQQFHSVVIV